MWKGGRALVLLRIPALRNPFLRLKILRMLASLMSNLMYWRYWVASSPFTLIISVFQLWMLIHAIRNREWIWTIFILFGSGLGAIWYYLYVYRASSTCGFELPGAHKRKRI